MKKTTKPAHELSLEEYNAQLMKLVEKHGAEKMMGLDGQIRFAVYQEENKSKTLEEIVTGVIG